MTCFNFAAAQNLTRILTRELQVKSTRDLFERIAPQDLALPRLGAISLAVLGAVFELKKIGGENPLEAWMRKHATKDAAAVVTFVSLKHRVEQREKKARKAARRSKASRLRVESVEGRGRETAAAATS